VTGGLHPVDEVVEVVDAVVLLDVAGPRAEVA
jgi:hypothetical protein